MTLLQPHLGEMRRQELRNSSFWDSSLFKSQLVKEGEDFLLKKGTSKDSQGFGPYKPVLGSTTRKEAPTGNAPKGTSIPHKAVTNRFPQVGGNRTSEAPGVVFNPTTKGQGVETPPPNDSLTASLGPPVGGRLHSFRRDWQTNKCSSNVLNIITNGYILPFFSKPNLIRFPLILSEYKAHQKDQALASCIQSLLSKNANERVENVKSLGFYSRLFLVPKPHQRWRPDICLSRHNTFLHIEKFKMETPESIRTSLIPREWVSSIDASDAYLHIPSIQLKEIPKVLLQVPGVPVHLPPIRTSHSPPGLYNDFKGSEANGPLQRTQTSPIPGRLADGVPVSGGSPSEHSGSGRPNPVLGLHNKSGKIRTESYSGLLVNFVGYEYHLDSALVKPTQERWLKLQDLILTLQDV